jgi:hypothetical protein
LLLLLDIAGRNGFRRRHCFICRNMFLSGRGVYWLILLQPLFFTGGIVGDMKAIICGDIFIRYTIVRNA